MGAIPTNRILTTTIAISDSKSVKPASEEPVTWLSRFRSLWDKLFEDVRLGVIIASTRRSGFRDLKIL